MRLGGAPERQLYLPQAQNPWSYFRVLLRTAGEPQNTAPALRQAVAHVAPGVPLSGVRPLRAVLDEFLLPQRSLAAGFVVLGAAALLLAVVGLYGVLTQFVARRTREIGVRVALGANRRDVLRLVLGRGLTLTAVGAVIGVAGALAMSRLLESFLFGVTATDPWTLAGITATLLLTALLACAAPALRASRLDPLEVLRDE